MNLPNRLTGKSSLPEGAFFFGYSYWVVNFEDGKVYSAFDDSEMPEELLRRYLDD